MLDQLKQIAIFSKTVDYGSFRGAARELRLSPSVISHHISQLEEELGTALLYRSTRKLSVTPDGEKLLVSARHMIDAAETGINQVTSQSQQPSGVLRLTIPAVLIRSELLDQIAAFALAFPKVQLFVDTSDSRRELIADGFDVAIRMGWLQDSALKAKKLFEVHRQLVASPGYMASRKTPRDPQAISEFDWIELAPVRQQTLMFKRGDQEKELSINRPRIGVNDADALCRLSTQGVGLAIIPDFLAGPEIKSGNLQTVLPEWSVGSVGVYAVWPPNARRESLVKRFIDYISR
ncbi:MAG: LysR family transcriptional regulator [Pseudomonadota bacterium]